MIGDVRSKGTIIGTVSSKGKISGLVTTKTVLANISVGPVEIVRRALPDYEGEYEATPTLEEQVMPTKNRSMLDDFVVHEIPYFETSNPSGGYTAIIGG